MKKWQQFLNFLQEEIVPTLWEWFLFFIFFSLGLSFFCILLWFSFYIPWSNECFSIQPLAKIMSTEPGSIFCTSSAAMSGLGLVQNYIQGFILSSVIFVFFILVYLCYSSRVLLWGSILFFGKIVRVVLLNYHLGKDILFAWPFTNSPFVERIWSSEEKIQLVEERLQQLCQQHQCLPTFLPEDFLKTEALRLHSRESIDRLVTEHFQVHYELYLKVLQAPLPYTWTNFCYDFALHLYHDPLLGIALSLGVYMVYNYFFGKPPTDT